MTDYTRLQVERRDDAAWIWMNNPELHNAFDEALIADLTRALRELEGEPGVRAIVLAGRGKSFSAGADLNWMKRQGAASMAENVDDAQRLAALYRTLAECAKPTLARVHGAAIGGGLGLACACDVCVASESASFATSEVLFGIIPSVISPYVVRAIGERQARRYFQTAERLDARRAREIGIAHEVVPTDTLDEAVQALLGALRRGGPRAQRAATELIRSVVGRPISDELIDDTAHRIATLRAGDEAREGLAAFLEKRPAAWAGS